MVETRVPKIVVEPPGPISRELRKLDEEYLFASLFLLGKQLPVAIVEGEGAVLKDADGNQYIDFTSGIAVCNVGHRHPKVVEAAKRQMDKLVHISQHVAIYEPYIKLAKKLAEVTPEGLKRTFLCNSGAEAMEGSVKVARYVTERPIVMAFLGSFHGQTTGMLNISAPASEWKLGFHTHHPGVLHVPYPYCYRCVFKREYPECDLLCLDYIRSIFENASHPTEVAAVVFEPIQGEKGVIVPPDNFLQKLERICRPYDILMIADEIQTGFGRTGKMFAVEHWNLCPDIIALAKGIADGFPIGAFVTKDEITRISITHGSTFGGNPVSCEAAIASIDVLLEERLPERASRLGSLAMKRLLEMKEKYPYIGDVRGKGLLIGIEIVKSKETKEPDSATAEKIRMNAMKKGLLLLGQFGKHNLRVMPPLTISEEQLEMGLSLIEEAIREASSK